MPEGLKQRLTGPERMKTIAQIVLLIVFVLIIIFLLCRFTGLDSNIGDQSQDGDELKPYISGQTDGTNTLPETGDDDNDDAEGDGQIASQDDGDGTTTTTDDILGDTSQLGSNGQSCSQNNECTSGYCVDGVCCNSACNGTCQRCDSIDGTVGTCHIVADNHDPDNECSQTWNNCSSSCQRTGGDGYCSGGSAACDSNDRTGNIASGYVCTGSGNQTAVSSTNYCNYDESCTSGSCSATQWWTSCNGAGGCRPANNHTDAYTRNVTASAGYSLTASCSTTGTTVCDNSWQYSSQPGDNFYGAGSGLRKYFCQGMCDGGGTCDYASNCILHYTVIGLETAAFSAVTTDDWTTDVSQNPQIGNKEIGIKDDHGQRIAVFNADFYSDLNWSTMTAESRGTKSFFHVPGGYSSIDGATGSGFTLYVFKGETDKVGICPGAASIGEVEKTCPGIYYLDESHPDVTVAIEDSVAYWKISNLTGTGAFSLSNLKDTLTREQVSTASNHSIEFVTTYSIDSNGDTIEVKFDPAGQAWNLSTIGVGDIDLEDDGIDKTLAATAAAGTWGVNINTSTDTITFTAPTDAGASEIVGGSLVTIKIGTNADGGSNQITNPATASSYELTILLNNGTDTDYGEIEVPIVDDDTVNITSFLDTFVTFDIDTSHTDEDCDAAGGASPCDSHSGTTDNIGYVVDLGELSSLSVSDSGDTVQHADGLSGDINYIYFNISTNSTGGAIVTLLSANGALNGPGANTIPSVTNDGDGVTISAGDGAYGIREMSNTSATGSFTISADYNGAAGVYGQCTTSATQIFSTSNAPLDTGRLQMEVAASPDSSDGTGTYTDTLTFIVTSTF